jgi:hypothetical protein
MGVKSPSPLVCYLGSADRSAPGSEPAARFSLFDAMGVAVVLGANDQIQLLQVQFVGTNTQNIYLFDGTGFAAPTGADILYRSPGCGSVTLGYTNTFPEAMRRTKPGQYLKLLALFNGLVEVLVHATLWKDEG